MHVNDDVPDPRDAEIEALRTRVDHLEEENSRLLEARNPLRESEEKYRRLFEWNRMRFSSSTTKRKDHRRQSAAAVLYGYSRDEILNMKNTDFPPNPEKPAVQPYPERSISGAVSSEKERDVFPVEIAASHLVYRDRQVHIAAIRDITGRKGAEDLLGQARIDTGNSSRKISPGILSRGPMERFSSAILPLRVFSGFLHVKKRCAGT